MELYNFFTEVTDDEEKIQEMRYSLEELNNLDPKPNFAYLVKRRRKINNKESYCIIGQILGEDTNLGDTDLLCIFSNLDYVLINAHFPEDVMYFKKGNIIKR